MTQFGIPLLTELGRVILTETGLPILVELVERREPTGGRKRKRGTPFTVPTDVVFPHEPGGDWEEEEALLLCGAI